MLLKCVRITKEIVGIEPVRTNVKNQAAFKAEKAPKIYRYTVYSILFLGFIQENAVLSEIVRTVLAFLHFISRREFVIGIALFS